MTQTRSNRTFKTAPMMRITRGARAQGAKTPEEKTEKLERTKKRTFSEVVKTPPKKMSKNGLKIVPNKTQGQKTLDEAFEAGKLIADAKKLRQQTLLNAEEIVISDEGSETSTESSSSDEFSSDSSTEPKSPKPKKAKKTKKLCKRKGSTKAKTNKKATSKTNTPKKDQAPKNVAGTSGQAKPTVNEPSQLGNNQAPNKILAKQAKKKGVQNGDLSEDQIANALKIGNTASLDLEGKIKYLEEVFNQCQVQNIPEHQVQRFISRIFAACKSCGFLVGMSHSIFKKEPTHIRVLEANLNETNLTWSQKKELLDKLLCVALPRGLDTEVLDQSRNGLSWVPNHTLSEEEMEISDKSIMTEKVPVQDNTSQTLPLSDNEETKLERSDTLNDSTKTLEIDTGDLDPSRNLFESSDLPITKVREIPNDRSSAASSPSRPDTTIEDDVFSVDEWICISDPHRIGQALEDLKSIVGSELWNVLRMIKALLSDTAFKCSKLNDAVGPNVQEIDYIMNDIDPPQHHHRFASIQENLLGLRNQIRNIRADFKSQTSELENTCGELKEEIQNVSFTCKEMILETQSPTRHLGYEVVQNYPSGTDSRSTPSAEPAALKADEGMAKLSNLVAGGAAKVLDIEKSLNDLKVAQDSIKHKLDHLSVTVGSLQNDVSELSNSRRYDNIALQGVKTAIARLDNEGPASFKKMSKPELEARIDLLSGDLERVKDSVRLNLSSSEMNEWLVHKVRALWETPQFLSKVRNLCNSSLANFQLDASHMNARFKATVVDLMREDLEKEVLSAFDANHDKFVRVCQEGMLKESDLPTTFNMVEAKKTLKVALSAVIKERMDVLSNTVTQVCDHLYKVLTAEVGIYESEAKLMDVIFTSNLLVDFFGNLSGSDEGLQKLIQGLRVWEKSAPSTRVDALDALISALKLLQKPVFADQVIALIKVGFPTKMDELVDYLELIAKRNLGDLSKVPLLSWAENQENDGQAISDTSLANPEPVATSSIRRMEDTSKSNNTRLTLDRLKAMLQETSTSVSKTI